MAERLRPASRGEGQVERQLGQCDRGRLLAVGAQLLGGGDVRQLRRRRRLVRPHRTSEGRVAVRHREPRGSGTAMQRAGSVSCCASARERSRTAVQKLRKRRTARSRGSAGSAFTTKLLWSALSQTAPSPVNSSDQCK